MLDVTKKLTDMTEAERQEFYDASLHILDLAKRAADSDRAAGGNGNHDVHRALVGAIYLKSFGRSAVNLRTEFDVDTKGFIFEAGRLLMQWCDRLKESADIAKARGAPTNIVPDFGEIDTWKAHYGRVFVDPGCEPMVRDLFDGWITHLGQLELKRSQ